MDQHPHPKEASLGELIGELQDGTVTLIKQEIALAKREMEIKADRTKTDAMTLGAGAAVAWGGYLALLAAITFLLMEGLFLLGLEASAVWLAPLIVAVVFGLIGFAMIKRAQNHISERELKPRGAIQEAKITKRWVEQKV